MENFSEEKEDQGQEISKLLTLLITYHHTDVSTLSLLCTAGKTYKQSSTIDKFLIDPKKLITQAKIVDLADVRDLLINPIDRLYGGAHGIRS